MRTKKELTQNIVRSKLMALGITLKKTEHGEFRVNIVRAREATAYYTDDLLDAFETGKRMAREGVKGTNERMLNEFDPYAGVNV